MCALLAEVSALLGRIPSAVGYQPTLATDLASLQEPDGMKGSGTTGVLMDDGTSDMAVCQNPGT